MCIRDRAYDIGASDKGFTSENVANTAIKSDTSTKFNNVVKFIATLIPTSQYAIPTFTINSATSVNSNLQQTYTAILTPTTPNELIKRGNQEICKFPDLPIPNRQSFNY